MLNPTDHVPKRDFGKRLILIFSISFINYTSIYDLVFDDIISNT